MKFIFQFRVEVSYDSYERILYTYPNGVYLAQISALSYVASWNND